MNKFYMKCTISIFLMFFSMINAFAQEHNEMISDINSITSCKKMRFFFNDFEIPIDKEKLSYRQNFILRKLSDKLIYWGATILLEGHADVSSTRKNSSKNSEKRVQIIRELLINYGVSADRIISVSMGEDNPPFPSNPQSHDNRTVVFQIIFCPPIDQAVKKLVFTTASTKGTYYPVGQTFSKMWTDTLKKEGIEVEAIESKGSCHNIELLRESKADIAIVTSDVAYQAYHGKGDYVNNQYTDFCAISSLWPDVHHFILSKKYISKGNIDDLNQKLTFCIGEELSSTSRSTNKILDNINNKVLIRKNCGDYNEVIKALRNKKYDGASISGGIPVSAIADLFHDNNEFKILQFTNAHVLAIEDIYVTIYTIPENTYHNQNIAIKTIAEPNILIVNKKLDIRIVRLLTEKLFENLPYLRWPHKVLKDISRKNAAEGLPVPLHEGAASIINQ